MTDFVAIVVGFVLTTVVGGWWATQLQQRLWERQNDVRLMEAERTRAAEVSQALSRLLDRRLYRMRRVFWAIEGYQEGRVTEEALEGSFAEYREILYEWNDGLNANLALIGAYFGRGAREYLYDSYEHFRAVGAQLERASDRVRQGVDVSRELSQLDGEFEGWKTDSLNQRNYLLGLAMMTQLREGVVGRSAPGKIPIPLLGQTDVTRPTG